MVPSKFIFMERLPLTSSGKIDRNALPPATASSSAEAGLRDANEQPSSGLQDAIEQAWKEGLDIDHIGLHENFFDLGANSLLVAEVRGELQQRLGREIPLVDLFHFPCVADLASHLGGEPPPPLGVGVSRARRRLAARANRALS
jgi:acyl carrier protein